MFVPVINMYCEPVIRLFSHPVVPSQEMDKRNKVPGLSGKDIVWFKENYFLMGGAPVLSSNYSFSENHHFY